MGGRTLSGWRALLTTSVLIFLLAAGDAAAQAGVTVSGDKFSKEITFLGVPVGINPFGGTSRMYRIRTWLDRETQTSKHQLYVDIGYIGDWRFYDRAADDDAHQLDVVQIATNVGSCRGGCSLSETVGVTLPEGTLRAKAATGFQIKLFAKSGDSLVLDITPQQIATQLAAIDGYRSHGAQGGSSGPLPLPPQSFGANFGDARPMWGLPGGALTSWISRDSVASRSGLKWADTIVEWDGQAVSSATDIQRLLAKVAAGQQVKFKVLRARKFYYLTATF